MADLKRERELAEKRKNDPPLELASDHPVRRLISRFRKISDNKLAVPNTDPEGGTIHVANNITPPGGGTTKIVNVSESGQSTGAQKWKKFMAGGGANGAATTPADGPSDTITEVNKNNHVTTVALNTTANNVVKPANNSAAPRPAKPASRWGKLLGKPDTIEEKPVEEEKELVKAKIANPAKTNIPVVDVTGSMTKSAEGPVTQRDITCSVTGSSNLSIANEQQLIASLYDIKLEIKDEIEILNQKMNKIDEQISEILKMFSPSSSPYCTHSTCSQSTSMNGSSTSTASNSIVTSPKTSQHSSPQRMHLDRLPQTRLGGDSMDSHPTERHTGRGAAPKLSKDSPRSSQDSSTSNGSKRNSPDHSDANNGNSASQEAQRRQKKRKSSGSRIRVAPLYNQDSENATTSFITRPPEPAPPHSSPTSPASPDLPLPHAQVMQPSQPGKVSPSKDDEHLPVKDRDLDIL